MKTTTTTREYDEQGRMVKETVHVVEEPASAHCYCTAYFYGWCPTHGQRYGGNITITTQGVVTSNVSASRDDLAKISRGYSRLSTRGA